MTVKKHLGHVFAKLGVETRTAAAGMAAGSYTHILRASLRVLGFRPACCKGEVVKNNSVSE